MRHGILRKAPVRERASGENELSGHVLELRRTHAMIMVVFR